MKCQVVTVSSYQPKPSYYYYQQMLASVRKFGVEPAILGWHEHWGGLATKPKLLKAFLQKGHQEGDVLLCVDAWDIVFQAPPEEILERYLSRFGPGTIVFNAERNCFPRGDLSPEYDKIAEAKEVKTPWKYLNSGVMIGTPANILKLLDFMEVEKVPDDHQLPDGTWVHPNDQGHYSETFLKQPVDMVLDYNTELAMAMHGSELEELDFTGPRFKNKITGTEPGIAHMNGHAKNFLAPTIHKHLGL